MKKGLRVILMAALMALPVCGFADGDNPVYHETKITYAKPHSGGALNGGWVNGKMPCPDNITTYSQAIDLDVPGNKGFVKSDQSYVPYTNSSTKETKWFHVNSYCQFSNNTHPVEGVMVYGVFINSTYTFKYDEATERLNLDSEGKMTKPLRMGVMFLKNDNGYPGAVVYKEEMDVYGTKSQGIAGDTSHGDDEVPIYAFQLNLKEKVNLVDGWVCVYACDTGGKQNTAFAIVSDATEKGAGLSCLEYENESGEIWSNSGAYNFCFTGDPNKYIANKALKFMRVLSPANTENGKYAKVQVEVWNFGNSAVSDATFKLSADGKELSTETVPEAIPAGEKYKYTFKKRIDCSAKGTHNFTVENVTPNDDQLAEKSISFSTQNNDGATCESRSNYNHAYKYITKVSCGDIDNSSDWSLYSDFTNLSTDIAPGQTLTLTVTRKAGQGDYIKAWVDWNGDGLFDGPGELLGYVSGSSLDFTIPTNATVKPGKHTMRIVLTDHDGSPCGVYSYGETEDYSINVVRPDDSPAMDIDKNEVCFDDIMNTKQQTLNIKNEGSTQLDTQYEVVYSLPYSPSTNPAYSSPKNGEPAKVNVAPAPASALKAQLPAATDKDPFVMTYAGDYKANTGSSYEIVDFAHYYPATATNAIKGMKITSVDVFVATPAETANKICIWKGTKGVQGTTQATQLGEMVLEQKFDAVADSWNHVVLNTPYVIGDDDIYLGMRCEGCKNVKYQVGVDNGPSNLGYGDLMGLNGYGWWSLTELGANANVLLRANVTGTRTPAISWLTIDKNSASMAAGQSDKLTATADMWALDKTVYDAAIKVKSNDQLAKQVTVPVYLDLSESTADNIKFINADASRSALHITREGRITLDTDKHVAYIALFTTDGRQLQMNFDTNYVDASTLGRGIYLVKAVLDDETTISGTVAVK